MSCFEFGKIQLQAQPALPTIHFQDVSVQARFCYLHSEACWTWNNLKQCELDCKRLKTSLQELQEQIDATSDLTQQSPGHAVRLHECSTTQERVSGSSATREMPHLNMLVIACITYWCKMDCLVTPCQIQTLGQNPLVVPFKTRHGWQLDMTLQL
jgi:hypothetical protein